MNKCDVINVLMTEVSERFGGRRVELKTVTKNNGVEMNGIAIEMEAYDNISATVYVDDIVELIMNGDITYNDAVNNIIKTYDGAQKPDFVGETNFMDVLTNKEKLLSRVHRNLISKELNKDCMGEFPHKEFCDLLIVYRVKVSDEATTRITNALMDTLGLTLEEIDEAARKNDKDIWKAISMGDMLRSTGNDFGYDAMLDVFMQIITNEDGRYGAASITDPEFMEKMAEKYNGDFYIIPCSIHECILLPGMMGSDVGALRTMVGSVNSEELAPGDILSDSVYFYNSTTKTVEKA